MAENPGRVRGAVYELVPDLLVRPGPRLVDGLEALAAIFHPPSLFGLRK